MLEVGSGRGELAAALVRHGYEVVAVDADRTAVKAAKKKKLDAREADFLSWSDEPGPFDAVVFGASLHHLFPLEEALRRAIDRLARGGLLLAEEFAHERMDRPTARWFYGVGALLEGAGLLQAREKHAHGHGASPAVVTDDALERWKHDHAHVPALHEGGAMESAIAARMELLSAARGAYLFRYHADRVPAEPAGEKLARKLLDQERRLIEESQIQPIGVRLVARRRPSPPI